MEALIKVIRVPKHHKQQTLWNDHFYIVNKESNWGQGEDANTYTAIVWAMQPFRR